MTFPGAETMKAGAIGDDGFRPWGGLSLGINSVPFDFGTPFSAIFCRWKASSRRMLATDCRKFLSAFIWPVN
jgi:hypothetical protein